MPQTFHDLLLAPLRIGRLELSLSPRDLALRVLLPLVLVAVAYALAMLVLRRLRLEAERERRARRLLGFLALGALAVVLLLSVLGSFQEHFGQILARIGQILVTPFFTAGSTRISIVTILLAIPVIFLSNWAAKLARLFMDRLVLRRLVMDENIRFTVSNLVRYGVLVLALIVGLSIIGINLSALAVLLGVIGIGLGFGLQNVVANYVAGLVIFLERPLKEGDRIRVEGVEGDVVQIKLRSTVINTLTNETIIVPNSQLIGNSVHNYSYRDKRIVIVNRVQVAYSTDLDQAREVLLEVAARNPYALAEKEPAVRVSEFQDSGIQLELWTWIAQATSKLDGLSWTNLEIWRAFRKQGIVIPFPQVDLHMQAGS
jgi:potassium-dependent mechanosensitive channel